MIDEGNVRGLLCDVIQTTFNMNTSRSTQRTRSTVIISVQAILVLCGLLFFFSATF